MSGLRTPIALFLLLTLLPAAILAFLGWRGIEPLVLQLSRNARAEVGRAFDRAAAALPAAMRDEDAALQRRLSAAAERLRQRLPFEVPGLLLREVERELGAAVVVRAAGRGQLLPRGPGAEGLEHLQEWPRFCSWRRVGDGGGEAAPPPFESAALRALAAATAWRGQPGRAAAVLQGLDAAALVAAGPLPVEVLAAAGDERLRQLWRDGWLDAVPATEAARLAWYRAAGADADSLRRQQLRAAAERQERSALPVLATAIGTGVELLALRAPAAALAALPLPREGDCELRVTAAAGLGELQFDGDGRAAGALPTPWGPVGISVVHTRLPGIEAQAARQRLLGGVGVLLLLGLMATGSWLVRRALLRERRARQLRLDFIANVSHELKTPLTAVRLHADMLAGDVDAATRQRYGEVVQGEGARLSALVDDLLDFAALEQGRRRLEPEPVDLGAAAATLARSWQARAEADGVQLACEVQGEALALMDPTALLRILTNLLQNAFRHGRPARDGGSSRIRVRAGPGPRLCVADNGPGVPAADRERIFARFEKRAASPGAGLGLALSRELAAACGGSLRLEDHGGETRFLLELPALPEPGLGEGALA